MRIGILTFHASCNYGGLLQCWAMQTALQGLGHTPYIIDRWLTATNWFLSRNFHQLSLRKRMRLRFRAFLRLGDERLLQRIRRSKRFARHRLHVTPYHFYGWGDAPQDMGLDAIVVGSDIVWHCGSFGDPRPYLLYGAPPIPSIAYAASFGMTELPATISGSVGPEDATAVYRMGFARFSAIGCREKEGVRICESLGFHARHVVDPVLLVEKSKWKESFGLRNAPAGGKPLLVFYYLNDRARWTIPFLKAFADTRQCRVDVFLRDNPNESEYLPMPVTISAAKRWLQSVFNVFDKVRFRESAGPVQFLKRFSRARWVVTDSFHGLMFATILGKNVRVLVPPDGGRRELFVRIADFASHFSRPVVCRNLDEALKSLQEDPIPTVDAEWLERWRKDSLGFLQESLERLEAAR